ncbi:MAG: TrgA family protein [Roseinatronobacter sp.]|nr:TrgA family protein [Roseinatronobacter sp.]
MPTVTRLAAMVLFGAVAYHLTELYFDALGYKSEASVYIMVVFAALVGWRLVGPKIDRSILRAFAIVFKGMGSTLFFAFSFSGIMAIFTNPAHKRYTSLEQAFSLLASDFWGHMGRFFVTDFGLKLLEGGVFVTLMLVVVFRVAEARRWAR